MVKRSTVLLIGVMVLACGSPEQNLEPNQLQTFADVYSDYLKQASRDKISPQQRDSLLTIVLREQNMDRQEFQEVLEYLNVHPESLNTVIEQTLEVLSGNTHRTFHEITPPPEND